MKFLTYDEKIILIVLVTLSLIMSYITTYLALNKKSMYEPISSGNIYVIKTAENYDPLFAGDFKKNKNKIGNFMVSKFDSKISNTHFDPVFWNKLVQEIVSVYDKYDAFVLYCDKDTLVYTASVLSFLLESLTKPVILYENNLVSTLKLASHINIPEVMVQSGGKLLRGCRTLQDSTGNFVSPNFPELTTLTALPFPKEPFKPMLLNPNIIISILKVFPGFDSTYLKNIVENPNINAIILENGGDGKIPTEQGFLNLINSLVSKGLVILIASKTNKHNTENLKLIEAGALLGGDITIPAAYAKLAFLLGNVKEKKIIGQLLEQSFRGEITINYPPLK
jgi:L-asparaginase